MTPLPCTEELAWSWSVVFFGMFGVCCFAFGFFIALSDQLKAHLRLYFPNDPEDRMSIYHEPAAITTGRPNASSSYSPQNAYDTDTYHSTESNSYAPTSRGMQDVPSLHHYVQQQQQMPRSVPRSAPAVPSIAMGEVPPMYQRDDQDLSEPIQFQMSHVPPTRGKTIQLASSGGASSNTFLQQ